MHPTTPILGLVINAPDWYRNPHFIKWLNSGHAMTWHNEGEPGEWSDAMIHVPSDLSEQCEDAKNLPQSIWQGIVEACEKANLAGQNASIPVRLTNLEVDPNEKQEAQVTRDLIIHAPEWLDNPKLSEYLTNSYTMSRSGPEGTQEMVAFVDPGLSGEGADSDMPEAVWDQIVDACRKAGIGGAGRPHIAVRITREAPKIDPELSRCAKAYYDELKQIVATVSTSHETLREMNSRWGEKAVEKAMKPLFDQDRDQAFRKRWEIVKDFYQEHGAEPSADHPERYESWNSDDLEVRGAPTMYFVYANYGYTDQEELYSGTDRGAAVSAYTDAVEGADEGHRMIELAYFAQDGEYVADYRWDADEYEPGVG